MKTVSEENYPFILAPERDGRRLTQKQVVKLNEKYHSSDVHL